jgi:hypothetical protein
MGKYIFLKNKLAKKIVVGTLFFGVLLFISCKTPDWHSQLLINHLGYSAAGPKKVVLQTDAEKIPESFKVLNSQGAEVYKGRFESGGSVDNWHTGKAYAGIFSELQQTGEFQIKAKIGKQDVQSEFFTIGDRQVAQQCLPLLVQGFQGQHPVQKYEAWDAQISFFGPRDDKVDVHGGWYDASGDVSKYLSHLSYANYMNPQQTPLVVWSMLEAVRRYPRAGGDGEEALLAALQIEAAHGADFLVRMQDPKGYFYICIFDNWSKDPKRREICAYRGSQGIRSDAYQAAFREGGGMAVAALAKASQSGSKGEYKAQTYLETAKKGFAHLIVHNLEYTDDGKENIIDDYCALMAATELYAASGDPLYLNHARTRMRQLAGRLNQDDHYKGWWRADSEGQRPYFHAVEAGLPVVALCRYLEVEKETTFRSTALQAIRTAVDFELDITDEVNNPFGYPRQYVKATNETSRRAIFFIPHQNESGYWWQGENARLASLASAVNMAMPYLDEVKKPRARKFAADQIDWILGLNPYDMCMLDGLGRNNPQYVEYTNVNFRGGVCNGITAGFTDETDIAFMPEPYGGDPANSWRWAEQWIPHSGWLILALTTSMAVD